MSQIERKCMRCETIIKGFGKKSTLKYKGLILKLRILNQCRACEEKFHIELIKLYQNKLFKQVLGEKGREIKIDWEFYVETARTLFYTDRASMDLLLESLGIFSGRMTGNFGVWTSGTSLNPGMIGEFYFTREEDAVAYATEEYKDASYEVEVRRVDKVIEIN